MTTTTGINVAQIAAPSPIVAGGVWRAPFGTVAPTDSTTALDAAFVSLGYIGEDGVTRKEDRPNTKQFAWGGNLIASLQEHYALTFTFKMLQIIDPDVQKSVHSDTNVSVAAATSSTGTIITTNMNPLLNVNSAWVIEGFYQLSTMRIAIPNARVTMVGDVNFTHMKLADFDITLESFPDTSGNFAYQIWDDGVFSV